jgi:XkdW protein
MISESLQYLFPNIDFEKDCLLEDDGNSLRITKWTRAEKQPTIKELEVVFPLAQAALLAEKERKQLEENQQQAGIVEAKKAYDRLQVIINSVDTATLAQLRLAIKEMAHDIQHLIRATVR